MANLLSISDDIRNYIFLFCDARSLDAICATSTKLKILASKDRFWKNLHEIEPLHHFPNMSGKKWHRHYFLINDPYFRISQHAENNKYFYKELLLALTMGSLALYFTYKGCGFFEIENNCYQVIENVYEQSVKTLHDYYAKAAECENKIFPMLKIELFPNLHLPSLKMFHNCSRWRKDLLNLAINTYRNQATECQQRYFSCKYTNQLYIAPYFLALNILNSIDKQPQLLLPLIKKINIVVGICLITFGNGYFLNEPYTEEDKQIFFASGTCFVIRGLIPERIYDNVTRKLVKTVCSISFSIFNGAKKQLNRLRAFYATWMRG